LKLYFRFQYVFYHCKFIGTIGGLTMRKTISRLELNFVSIVKTLPRAARSFSQGTEATWDCCLAS